METLITKIQNITVWVFAGVLIVVVAVSTGHLGVLITPAAVSHSGAGPTKIFGYFLLVLIGVDCWRRLKRT